MLLYFLLHGMPISMVLYYFLLPNCLYLWYFTTFFWVPVYPYGTLLSFTGSLPIPMVLYHLLLVTAYTNGTLSSTGSLPITMLFYYHLPDTCLYLLYPTTFYWLPDYPFGTLLPSTGSLTIPMLIYYLLLANCLSLWYSITFYWPIAYSTIVYWLNAYVYQTLLSSTGSLPTTLVLYYLLLDQCLSL